MLKARASRREITPDRLPIALGGYAVGHAATRIVTPLEVNCLCVQYNDVIAVIVSLDLLYVTHQLRAAVMAEVRGIGLTATNVFMAASHTHYAPAIDSTKPLLGTPDLEYLDRIAVIVVEAVRDAVLGPKKPVTVEVRQGTSVIGVNRRRKRAFRAVNRGIEFNRVSMCPNPKGQTDAVASVVSFVSEGRAVGHVWSAACHPTGLADDACVSAHWPGVVREQLRGLDGNGATDDVPVLFLQGFSGDVRPPSGRPKGRRLRTIVDRLRLGPVFENLDKQEYSTWAQSAACQVSMIAAALQHTKGNGTLECARIELPASRFALGAEGLPPVSFHRLSIGPVTLVGASAELVSGYASKVRALAPDQYVIPVGCIDHAIGYWPLQHMFGEGGYEVVHHCPSFGITACAPDIEAVVMEQFRLLMSGAIADDRG